MMKEGIRMLNIESLENSKHEIKVVFYSRFASVKENQMNVLKEMERKHNKLIKEHPNWVVTYKYCDFGFSGTKIKSRPSLVELLQDAKNGKFELVVVQSVSKLARNPAMALEIINALKKLGVEVYFADEGIWSFSVDTEYLKKFNDVITHYNRRNTFICKNYLPI